MKSILLAAALMLAAITTKALANDVKVNPVVLRTFETTFGKTSNVQWSVVEHLYRADFTQDGENVIAFFSADDGSYVASGRYITTAELPRVLRSGLKAHTDGAVLSELFEVQNDEGTTFYATIQNGQKTTVLKSGANKWGIYKKG